MLAHALVSSKLDYCNSLLAYISEKELRRMQVVQNKFCRVVCKLPWRFCVSKYMRSLHWLPLKCRVNFKLEVVIFVYCVLCNVQCAPVRDYLCRNTTHSHLCLGHILQEY